MTAVPTFDSIDHLNYEAVAALIDDELSPTALHRAHQHLAQCPDCRREVAQQQAAAEAVREHNTDGCLRAPRSLVERLAHLDDASRDTRPSRDAQDTQDTQDAHDSSEIRGTTSAGTPDSGRKWPIAWSHLRDRLK